MNDFTLHLQNLFRSFPRISKKNSPEEKILTVITHYQKHEWLIECIESIVNQSKKSTDIVVVDDQSDELPQEAMEKFPNVTFMQSSENGGPFKIQQYLLENACHDYILLQDSDDWSHPNRLEILLQTIKNQAADMVGSQLKYHYEFNISEKCPVMPLDPKMELIKNPLIYPVFWPTCLIDRRFALKVGGLSSGFRFGADSEFIRRAVMAGNVINVDQVLYFRRIHPESLTHHPLTGFGSPGRLKVQQLVRKAAQELVNNYSKDGSVSTKAICKTSSASLMYLSGPEIEGLK